MEIKNIEGLSKDQLRDLVKQGGKFVMFRYAVSVVVMSYRNNSNIYFIRPGEGTFKYHVGHTALSTVMGWWGIPWGPIYTIGTIYTNFNGGTDVTKEISNHLGLNDHSGYNIPGTQGNPQNTPPPASNSGSGAYNIPR